MLARAGRYVIAAGGITVLAAFAAAALAQERAPPVESVSPGGQDSAIERDDSAAQQPDAAETAPPVAPQVGALATEKEAKANKTEADEELRDIAWRDLTAQEGMFYAAVAAAVLTFVGVLLIWRTLLYTRSAAESAVAAVVEAKNATAAARDAVTETSRIGEAQTRAYLACRGARYEITRTRVAAILSIENTGQSPASDIRIYGTAAMYSVGGRPSMPRVLSSAVSQAVHVPGQSIASGGVSAEKIEFYLEFHFSPEEGEDPEIKKATFQDGNEVWFNLTISWRDVFSKPHHLAVELWATVDASPNSPKKKRSGVGKLLFRMEDAQPGVGLPEGEDYAG